MKKYEEIPLKNIVVEDIDPHLQKDQVVEEKIIEATLNDKSYFYLMGKGKLDHWKVSLTYRHKLDSLAVTLEALSKSGEVLYAMGERGARGTFNQMVSIVEKGIYNL